MDFHENICLHKSQTNYMNLISSVLIQFTSTGSGMLCEGIRALHTAFFNAPMTRANALKNADSTAFWSYITSPRKTYVDDALKFAVCIGSYNKIFNFCWLIDHELLFKSQGLANKANKNKRKKKKKKAAKQKRREDAKKRDDDAASSQEEGKKSSDKENEKEAEIEWVDLR